MNNKYNKYNFNHYTKGKFINCKKPSRTPDVISETGSEYWFTFEGLIRNSKHWGVVGSCSWYLDFGCCGKIDFKELENKNYKQRKKDE